MPLPLALRLEKLMHDVGNIEPEPPFQSATHYEKTWRLAAGIQAEYHAPGRGVAQRQCISSSDGHAQHNPTGDSRHNTFTVLEGE